MATERQIEANRRNAALSSGPKSPEGKARSRANATKHGMAGENADVEAGISPEFADRRARWAAERNPVGEAANWALDRAVAASIRIEKCERAIGGLTADSQARARLAWDQDRAVEAATTFGRLAQDPVLASRQLQTTLAGVELLVEAWFGLLAVLQAGADWSESESSRALDLLGVAADLRAGRTMIDTPEGSDSLASRRELALEEIERLEQLRDESLAPLDEMDRQRAMAGDTALLSKEAKLVLRYERDAWRRHRESMKQLDAPAPPPAVAPAPAVARPSMASEEEERRAILDEAAPFRLEVTDRLRSMGLDDEDAWLDELERRIEANGRILATERSRFGGVAIDPGP